MTDQAKKWLWNLAIFSAPTMGVFFGLLSEGVPFEKAWPVAILTLWGALSDAFKKLNQQ
jgi:hypothetical protein